CMLDTKMCIKRTLRMEIFNFYIFYLPALDNFQGNFISSPKQFVKNLSCVVYAVLIKIRYYENNL
ncbi:hypothetical protein BpHYR1_047594, partial [Brachionus plicatilis]